MVNDTNAKPALTGEASNSHLNRQQLLSIAENCGGATSGNSVAQLGRLYDVDLLDCPICCYALSSPIYQCNNGHIACPSCCIKLENICPSCNFPIGNLRSRIMERFVESVFVLCRNAKHGCTKKLSYGKELAHEKECNFALCYCPEPNCNYTGVYKDLYSHYSASHKAKKFRCDQYDDAWVLISEKMLVLQEYKDGPLVVVQCFKEPLGMYVSVSCIAHSTPEVGKFSYHLIYRRGIEKMTFESEEMNKIQKVSFQTPEVDYMVIPNYFLEESPMLKVEICIHREEEEEDED